MTNDISFLFIIIHTIIGMIGGMILSSIIYYYTQKIIADLRQRMKNALEAKEVKT